MNPCGAVCDWSRKPGWTTQCRFFRDRPDVISTIVWYPANADADVLPFDSAILAAEWDRWPWESQDLGEVWEVPKPYSKQDVKPGALGSHICGTADDFRLGCVYDTANPVTYGTNGLPHCCEPVVVGSGGAGVGGTASVGYRPPVSLRGGGAGGGFCGTLYVPPVTPGTGGVEFGGAVGDIFGWIDPTAGGVEFGGRVGDSGSRVDATAGGVEFGASAGDRLSYSNPTTGGVEYGGSFGPVFYPPGPNGGTSCSDAPLIPLGAEVSGSVNIGVEQWYTVFVPASGILFLNSASIPWDPHTGWQMWGGACPGGLNTLALFFTSGQSAQIVVPTAGVYWLEVATVNGLEPFSFILTM